MPMVRPMHLEYPDERQAYATADSQYFYGPDMLVAPVTSPGATASVSVWSPPGQWADYFTGKTYTGHTTRTITAGLTSMPVFVKSGGIVPTRTGKVTNDAQNPLTKATLTIAQGASGRYNLDEDNGTTTTASDSATTGIRYTENGSGHTLRIGPAAGSFRRQVTHREWTVKVLNARAPKGISVNGELLGAGAHHWDSTTRTLTVELPRHNIKAPLTLPTTDPQRRSVRRTPRPSGPGSVPDGLSEKQHGAAPRAGFRVEDEQTVDGAGHPVHRLGAGVLQR